jgi:hypothetical protein
MTQTLAEMGPVALQHRNELEEVKRRLGVRHEYFDCWIYSFLENKFFDVEETVAKLHRRAAMERDEMASYEITDFIRHQMSKGLIQLTGLDKEGRVTFYVMTARDKPLAERREESKRNFDMWMSYGTRLRPDNKRCRVTLLINQDDAGVFANTDMTFQMNIALRLSKFFPGMIERSYVCKMGRTLAAFAKAVFGRFPKSISEKIFIVTDSDIAKGYLFQHFDKSVLPVALGGAWDHDNTQNWQAFSDTIESHFMEVQKGLRAGKSVKEWELEQLGIQQQAAGGVSSSSSIMPDSRHRLASGELHRSFASLIDVDEAEFRTCISDDAFESSFLARNNDSIFGNRSRSGDPTPGGWASEYHHYSKSVSFENSFFRFFLQQESTCRRFVSTEEQRDRLRLADLHSSGLLQAEKEDMTGARGVQTLAVRYIPEGARSVFRFTLLLVNVVVAILFCASTVFFVALACSVSVTLFFGMFEGAAWVFPVGCGLCLAIVEGALIISRGMELTVSSLHGTLLPPLQPFRTYGPVLQAILLFVIVFIQLIILFVYSSVEDPLNGLRTAFATGWLTCALVVAVYNTLSFPLGYGARSEEFGEARGETKNHFRELSLFLFFDITEEEDREHAVADDYLSADLIGFVPSLLCVLFGTGLMLSGLLLFAAATPPLSAAAAFLTSYVVYQRTERHSTRLMRFMAWLGCLVWVFVSFRAGFDGWAASTGAVVVIVSLIFGLLFVMAFTANRIGGSNWLLRATLFLLVLLYIACLVMTFVLVHWGLGVFVLLISLHCMLCLRLPNAALPTAVALLTACVVTVIVACVLVGWSSTPALYNVVRSAAPSSSLAAAAGDSMMARFFSNPLCALAKATDGLNIVDLALMNEVFRATPYATFATDRDNWLGNWTLQLNPLYQDALVAVHEAGPSPSIPHPLPAAANTTVLVFLGTTHPFQQIRSVAPWVDAMVLSPLSLLLPGNWSRDIITTIGFASRMVPSQHQRTLREASAAIRAALPLLAPRRQVVITGSRLTGGLAAAVALNLDLQSVTFGAPAITDVTGKLGIADPRRCISCLHHNIVATGGSSGGIASASGTSAPITSIIPCSEYDRSDTCQSDAFFSRQLLDLCGSGGRVHLD